MQMALQSTVHVNGFYAPGFIPFPIKWDYLVSGPIYNCVTFNDMCNGLLDNLHRRGEIPGQQAHITPKWISFSDIKFVEDKIAARAPIFKEIGITGARVKVNDGTEFYHNFYFKDNFYSWGNLLYNMADSLGLKEGDSFYIASGNYDQSIEKWTPFDFFFAGQTGYVEQPFDEFQGEMILTGEWSDTRNYNYRGLFSEYPSSFVHGFGFLANDQFQKILTTYPEVYYKWNSIGLYRMPDRK